MATPLLQKARQQKMIYFGAIVVLFTLSLIHREFVVKPQAYRLQLLETSRGEVKLTSSAVRLMLTGSRGLAVTMLWYNAMDKQKRNEWNELELLVESITQLQPYFITPWLYQSWNLSFNVAVECDRPRDKYYYITRGLELLSEGERRNSGRGDESLLNDPTAKDVFPGHPDMRYYMGFTYQLKMGTSDERLTMRCLLEMSCIDPIERNPDRFWTTDEKTGQQKVNLRPFALFCQKHPRLVRRLSEQLAYSTPEQVVKFLQDHQGIPNRFKPIEKSNLGQLQQSELKEPRLQFPILPPYETGWPDPAKVEMTSESVDVYLVSRTWYEFAQKPLPPPDKNAAPQTQNYDKTRFRLPRNMVTQIFRQYPARGQVYIAETLESEGWFDSEGWDVPRWFDDFIASKQGADFANDEGKFAVGQEPKYYSRLAWARGHRMYRDFGIDNGIYLTPREIDELNRRAQFCRDKLGLKPGEVPQMRSEWRQGELGASLDAQLKLHYSQSFRQLTNFNAFFYQSEAESDPVTVAARKQLFYAERKRKREVPSESMLSTYDEAWLLYAHACVKYPKFAQVTSMQEDFCEVYQKYLRECQNVRSEMFKKKLMLSAKLPFLPYPLEATDPTSGEIEAFTAKLAFWPYPNWLETVVRSGAVSKAEKDEQQMIRILPIRERTGPVDRIQYYDGPAANDLRGFLFAWTQGAALAQNMSFAATVTYPGLEYHMLTRTADSDDIPSNWTPLITKESRRIARNRLFLDRAR